MILAATILIVTHALTAAPDALLLDGLEPGTALAEAKGRVHAKWLDQTQDKALAEGLVRTRLLETLNKLELAPKDETKSLDATAFQSIAIVSKPERTYVAAFGPRRRGEPSTLRYLMIRIATPVDTEDPGANRMHKLKDALRELDRSGYDLKPAAKDAYGNVFQWTARRGKSALKAIYVPEDDELRVVIW